MKLLLAILWACCHDMVFLQACTEKAGRQASDNGLTCVTNYWLRISCVLNATVQPLNKERSHWLKFQHCVENDAEFECQLVNVGQDFSCSFQAEIKEQESFISADRFKVTLHSQRSGHETQLLINSTFQPAYNVKPDAPNNLTVVRNSSGYLFTWSSNYESHSYRSFSQKLHYKLLYHRTGFPDQASIVHTVVKTQQIDDNNLETDTEYTAVVCSCPPGPIYQGQCSEWSSPVNWRSKSKPVRDWEKITFLWNIVLPMCVIAGILLCFFFSPTVRLKIKVWSVIPTPAPYFQPLFTSYKGNFRSWLVSQGGPEEPLKMEDVQEIDRVREAQPLQGEESCPPAPAPHSCPTPYVTPGDDGWCMGSPTPSPTLRDPPDTLLPLSLLKVCLAEIFGSQSLGLVLAGEGDWENEKVLAGERQWVCKDPRPSLDCCWPQDALTSPHGGPSTRLDYCTLSGLNNEFVSRSLTPCTFSDPHNELIPETPGTLTDPHNELIPGTLTPGTLTDPHTELIPETPGTLTDPHNELIPETLAPCTFTDPLKELIPETLTPGILTDPHNELIPGTLTPCTLTDPHNELVPKTPDLI